MKNLPNVFRHWQSWLGLVACGICGAAGAHIGMLNGHSVIGAAIGGGIGGYIFHLSIRYGSGNA